MRKQNAIRNIIVAILLNVINILVGFISQKIFVEILGQIYLGINGLFSNIISMLSIADLGLGTAIIYNLYKPIAEDNRKKISILMNFYKKSYRIIAVIILLLGLAIMPFLTTIVSANDVALVECNIYIIFALFLVDTVCSYLLTYKRSMLYANQKNYIINLVHIGYVLVMNILQIIILMTTHNYYLYLMIKIVCRIIENIIITYIVNKKYEYLKGKINEKLDAETKLDISRRLKASIFHNVGGFLVLGTDNIIISKFIGIATVGLYSNYYLIINTVNNLLAQFFTSITASLGNLLVEKNTELAYEFSRKCMFANFWIYTFATICIFEIINPFISVWLGKDYLFDTLTVFVLSMNFYFQGMRRNMQLFADAAGICYENRYVPIAEAVVNIVASIILVKLIGLPGVFIGTILSSLVLHCYSYPKYIYSRLLKQKKSIYILNNLKYLVIMLLLLIITTLIVQAINLENIMLQIIVNLLICILVPNIILFIIYRKSDNFIYFFDIIKQIFRKINARRRKKCYKN